jgi:hypothetical protein
MKARKNPKDFELFLLNNGYDSSKIEYISKDCESYKVKNVSSGVIGYIRY